MSDIKKSFHETAIESILFKGRHDWYFCYLKSERIAHVLALLGEKVTSEHRDWFADLVDQASALPHTVAHFVAGEVDVQVLLADIFALLSSVRLCGTRRCLSKETSMLIANEYEHIAEKIAGGNRLSPFVSRQDFAVPDVVEISNGLETLALHTIPDVTPSPRTPAMSETTRKPSKGQKPSKGHSSRSEAILHFVLQNKGVSIKDICAIVPDCSEKTVQRELITLISRGLVKREGERRWSVYKGA